jgi:flagellar hook assembly protein FlgD
MYSLESTSDVSEPEPAPASLAYPNPARETTTVRFSRPLTAGAQIRVSDTAGRVVWLEPIEGKGTAPRTWDGRDAGGNRVPAGMYLYEVSDGTDRITGRWVITR